VEAIQAGTWDASVLRQFATLATDLLAQPGPRAVVTFVRPTLLAEVQKAVDISNRQKAFPDQSTIPPLSWEQAVQVVRFRLDAEPSCRAARQLRPGELDWPVGRRFLEETFHQNRLCLTPRHLIMACRLEFDKLQKGKRSEGTPVTDPGTSPPTAVVPPSGPSPDLAPPPALEPTSAPRVEEFCRMWEKQRTKLLAKLQGIQFDAVLAIGLPWLAQLSGLPYVCAQDQDERLGDVNLVFQPQARGDKAVGVSFCNHQPRSLWRRLDRLRAQWKAAKGKNLGALAVLRSAAEQTTAAAQGRLDALDQAGVRVILVERQQLAELAAFQGMLTAALEGDLTRNGRPVEPGEYDAWAKEHLSEAVKEFLQVVFEPSDAGTATPPAARGKPARAAQAKK